MSIVSNNMIGVDPIAVISGNLGKIIGGNIYLLNERSMVLGYDDAVRANALRLNEDVKMFDIIPVTVTSCRIDRDPMNNMTFFVFNPDDAKYQNRLRVEISGVSYTDAIFPKVNNEQKLFEVIQKAKRNQEIALFVDGKTLCNTVMSINNNARKRMEGLINQLLASIGAAQKANQTMENMINVNLALLGQSNIDITLNIP